MDQFDFRAMRDSWKAQVETQDLLEAAAAKVERHIKRLEFWQEREAQAELMIREKGIDFREAARFGVAQQANTVQYASIRGENNPLIQGTPYMEQVPVFNPELLAALKEAQDKVRHHMSQARLFGHWVAFFEMKPNSTVPMSFEDVQFFGLAEGTVSDSAST